jgi:hypothetical protein
MRGLMRFVGASLVLLVGVGCTTIPTTGPVLSADMDTGLTNVDFDFLPPGPSAGASPDEILAGFIAAGTAAQDNYRVARSYLDTGIFETWNPNTSVLIRGGEPQITVVSEDVARYVVPVVASVDEFGRYSESPTPANQMLEFRFTKQGDEWRIASLPDGIVLTEAAFAEAFASYRLYYFSPGYRELVPDIRWFATRGEVPAKIVRSLLQPPSYWLNQGATVSAFPEGSQLALSPIPVTDGVARVDLTTTVLSANELDRQRMLVQLTTSLSQVQGISSARISVNQNELVIPALGEDGPSIASGRDPRYVVLRDRRFGHLQGGRIEQIDGLSLAVANLIPQRIFYSAGLEQALVTRTDGLWRDREGVDPALIDARQDLIRGVLDNCAYVWSSTKLSEPDMMQVISSDGAIIVVPLDLGADAELVSFELARDDTRLLLLVQTETGVRVLLTAVSRTSECVPDGLGEFVELGLLDGNAVDAAWIDDSRVAVVVADGTTGVGEVLVLDTSGRSLSLGRPSNPATLVGGVGGIAGLRLLSTDGVIYQPRGNGWQATGDRANVLATQR